MSHDRMGRDLRADQIMEYFIIADPLPELVDIFPQSIACRHMNELK